MNKITMAGMGSVDHPDIINTDVLKDILDGLGLAGMAQTVPQGTDFNKFLLRSPGYFYYDNPAKSGSKGGPTTEETYYLVISGELGFRAVFAFCHDRSFWLGEVYGDVLRGWRKLADDTTIRDLIKEHEENGTHKDGTEERSGFLKLATKPQAESRTNHTAAMTSLRTQDLLNLFGIGDQSVKIPDGSDLGNWFKNSHFGFYRVDDVTKVKNSPVTSGWLEIICCSHQLLNFKGLIALTREGELFTATYNSGSFSGWKKKIELKDIPMASKTVSGLVKLETSTSSTSETTAATPLSVKQTWDRAETKVPMTRKINGMALDKDLNLTADNVGAYNKAEVDTKINSRVPITRKVNGKPLSTDITLNAGDVGAYNKNEVDVKINSRVPTTRKVNGKALDKDIVIDFDDVGTYSKEQIDRLVSQNTGITDLRASAYVTQQANRIWIGGGKYAPPEIANTFLTGCWIQTDRWNSDTDHDNLYTSHRSIQFRRNNQWFSGIPYQGNVVGSSGKGTVMEHKERWGNGYVLWRYMANRDIGGVRVAKETPPVWWTLPANQFDGLTYGGTLVSGVVMCKNGNDIGIYTYPKSDSTMGMGRMIIEDVNNPKMFSVVDQWPANTNVSRCWGNDYSYGWSGNGPSAAELWDYMAPGKEIEWLISKG